MRLCADRPRLGSQPLPIALGDSASAICLIEVRPIILPPVLRYCAANLVGTAFTGGGLADMLLEQSDLPARAEGIMDVAYINPFLQATRSVFDKMSAQCAGDAGQAVSEGSQRTTECGARQHHTERAGAWAGRHRPDAVGRGGAGVGTGGGRRWLGSIRIASMPWARSAI